MCPLDRLLVPPGRLRRLPPSLVQRAARGFAPWRRHAPPLSARRVRGYAGTAATSAPTESESAPAPAGHGPPEKPYYVTTPIFYVNAAPHIGHLYSMVLADVLKRWALLKGRPALLLTGTDEHGLKIQQAAAANDTPPKAWCDAQSARFKELAARAHIAHDFFLRTTDEDHKDAVRHFWHLLQHRGLVYAKEHAGWYSVGDEAFVPEKTLVRTVNPITGDVFIASAETGHQVEQIKEKNYYFRMTALKDRLLAFYAKNPAWVVPAHRMTEVVSWATSHLEDLSISRPSARLDWGIRVPGDDSQTIYVWLDALVNYLTKAGFPSWAPDKQAAGGWPADVHVLGKDILRFHGVYWPALLLALDLPPPKRLLSHAHWLMSNRKMSKSLGNVVDPFHAMDRFGVDPMRLFMISDGGIDHDTNYDNALVEDRYTKLLQSTLGNLLNRVARAKTWQVHECVQAAAHPSADAVQPSLTAQQKSWFRGVQVLLAELRDDMDSFMEKSDPRRALMCLMKVGAEANKFATRMEPWQAARQLEKLQGKDQSEASRAAARQQPNPKLAAAIAETRALVQRTVYLLAEALRVMGILLQPFMPTKAAELLDVLGVAGGRRTYEFATPDKDATYGNAGDRVRRARGKTRALFPPLEVVG